MVNITGISRGRLTKTLSTVIIGAGILCVSSGGVMALEGSPPFLSGVEFGVPVGALPPPGVYFSNNTLYKDLNVRDSNGNKVGVDITAVIDVPQLLWVPDVKILGASYGAFIAQPMAATSTAIAGGRTSAASGFVNTLLSPVNLSWALPGNLHASASFIFYPDIGNYESGRVANPARGYWTVEPSVALSYLADGWNITGHLLYDINGTNDDTDYSSGDILSFDGFVTKAIKNWTVGAGVYYSQQVTDDKSSGITVRNSKFTNVAFGPMVGYDFGPVSVMLYYTYDAIVENGAGGSTGWMRWSLPF